MSQSPPELPLLAPEVCRSELTPLFEKRRRELLVCFRARGEAAEFEVPVLGREAKVPFRMVPTRSEIELRERMPEFCRADRAEEGFVFLVPWLRREEQLPLDLQGRFVAGRALQVGTEQRLMVALSARALQPRVFASKFAVAILEGRLAPLSAEGYLKPDLHQLLDLYAEERLGLEPFERRADDAILRWTVAGRDADALATKRADDPLWNQLADDFVRELIAHLCTQHGRWIEAVVAARLAGRGVAFLAALVLIEAWLEGPEPDQNARDLLRSQLGEEIQGYDALLTWFAGLTSARRQALIDRVLEPRDGEFAHGQAIMSAANARAEDWAKRYSALAARLAASPRLELSRKAREKDFEEALGRFVAAPTRANWLGMQAKRRTLVDHRKADPSAHRDLLRLGAWLCEKDGGATARMEAAAESSLSQLSRDYVEEGGWVDLARQRVRSEALNSQNARALLDLVDRIRDAQDLRFADELLAVIADDKWESQGVWPIHLALEKATTQFLSKKDRRRRLLVLVLDGASQATLAELLETMEEQSPDRFGPLNWSPINPRRLPLGFVGPVIAELPTVTVVSRASLFEGKPRVPGQSLESKDDPKRFREHPVWRKVCAAEDEPDLFLEGKALDTAEGLSTAMREAIASECPVVGMVYNVIDKQLDGPSEQRTKADLKHLRSLPSLLDAAKAAGRAVLLLSDHGHVRTERLRAIDPPDSAESGRHRLVREGEALHEGERLLPPAKCWRKKGTAGVAVLVGERHRYSKQPGSGLHGGLSLAECIAVGVLLGPEHPLQAESDEALTRAPMPIPGFWDVERVFAMPVTSEPRLESVEGGFQFSVISPTTPREAKPVEAEAISSHSAHAHPLLRRLRESPLYKDRLIERNLREDNPEVERAEKVLQALLDVRGNRVGFDTIARLLEVPRFQVQAYLFRVAELFNLGEMTLELDMVAKEVCLDEDCLKACFELGEDRPEARAPKGLPS